MANPLVSIVMPVWNGERYLFEAVQSILNQSYQNFELIIVDDASDDSTPEILAEVSKQDRRVKVITNQNNLRLPGSLNVGFGAAQGEWFTWTSDDNILEARCIQLLLSNALIMHSLFVFCDYKIIDEHGEVLKKYKTGPGELIYLENTVGACFLYHRDIAAILKGYSDEKFMFEDYDFWVRARKAGYSLNHIEGISPYRYRLHSNQLSQKNKMPSDFIYYRYNLIPELKTKKLKYRAYLSVFHLSLSHGVVPVALLTGAKLFLANPILGLYAISKAAHRRLK